MYVAFYLYKGLGDVRKDAEGFILKFVNTCLERCICVYFTGLGWGQKPLWNTGSSDKDTSFESHSIKQGGRQGLSTYLMFSLFQCITVVSS